MTTTQQIPTITIIQSLLSQASPGEETTADTSTTEPTQSTKPSADTYYSNSAENSRKLFNDFARSPYGKYLKDHAHARKEAEDLNSDDKSFRKTQLDRTITTELTNQIATRSINLSQYFANCAQFSKEHSSRIYNGDPILDALKLLAKKASDQLKQGEIPLINIPERDQNGKLTGNQISIQKIVNQIEQGNQTYIQNYINDPKLRTLLVKVSQDTVLPDLSTTIDGLSKKASEEVKSQSLPILGTMIAYAGVNASARGLGYGYSKLMPKFDSWFYRDQINIIKKSLMPGAPIVGTSIPKVVGNVVKEFSISESAATRLLRLASPQSFGAVSKFTWSFKNILGLGSKLLGFGGPVGLALSMLAPFVIELAIAEAQDAFTVATGRESKNKGFMPIGEWVGGLGRSYAQAFNMV